MRRRVLRKRKNNNPSLWAEYFPANEPFDDRDIRPHARTVCLFMREAARFPFSSYLIGKSSFSGSWIRVYRGKWGREGAWGRSSFASGDGLGWPLVDALRSSGVVEASAQVMVMCGGLHVRVRSIRPLRRCVSQNSHSWCSRERRRSPFYKRNHSIE